RHSWVEDVLRAALAALAAARQRPCICLGHHVTVRAPDADDLLQTPEHGHRHPGVGRLVEPALDLHFSIAPAVRSTKFTCCWFFSWAGCVPGRRVPTSRSVIIFCAFVARAIEPRTLAS